MKFRMSGIAAAIVSTMIIYAQSDVASAQERCPAGESGCTVDNAADRIRERVDQGVQDVWDADSMWERVDAVRDTLNDCFRCGMDAVNQGVDDIGRFDDED